MKKADKLLPKDNAGLLWNWMIGRLAALRATPEPTAVKEPNNG